MFRYFTRMYIGQGQSLLKVRRIAKPRLLSRDGTVNGTEETSFTPFRSRQPYDLETYVTGMPPVPRQLAQDETLQCLLEEDDGEIYPVVSTAFWSVEDRLTGAEPWEDIVTHGAHIIAIEMMEIAVALPEIENDYDFSPDQIALVQSLYERRRGMLESSIILTSEERAALVSHGDDGLEECREMLLWINMRVG